jgi:hypothetical protein
VDRRRDDLTTPLLVALGVSLATPFGEEVVCRGFLLRGFEARTSRWFAVAASSVIFGLLHLENLDPLGWLHVISATLAGVLFALALLRTGHLIAAVTAHVVVNTLYTVLGLLAGGTLFLTVGPDGDCRASTSRSAACAQLEWWTRARPSTRQRGGLRRAARRRGRLGRTAARRPRSTTSPPTTARWRRPPTRPASTPSRRTSTGTGRPPSTTTCPALPDLERWDAGERELVCLVVPWEDDELTEPARGSGR